MADGSQSKDVAVAEPPSGNGRSLQHVVQDPIGIFDTARFEHMQRIAVLMARASLVPEHLKGQGADQAVANCLLVVNQADRWGIDPFALAQHTFVREGKIGYEGKVLAAVLAKLLGLKLRYDWSGPENTPERAILVRGPEGDDRPVKGTVAKWRTTKKDGTTNPLWLAQPDEQLLYRGTRQWCRLYEPGIILGVLSEDEVEHELEQMTAFRARDITPAAPAIAAPKGPPPAPPKGPPAAPQKPAQRPAVEDAKTVALPAETASGEPAKDAAVDSDPLAMFPVYLDRLDDEMLLCGDKATLDEVWASHTETSDGRLSSEQERQCAELFDKHADRFKAPVP